MVTGQFGEQGKPWRCIEVGGRDGHQANNGQTSQPGFCQQCRQIVDSTAALLGFFSKIDLDKAIRSPPGPVHCPGERVDEI